jgi:hypothetical protein
VILLGVWPLTECCDLLCSIIVYDELLDTLAERWVAVLPEHKLTVTADPKVPLVALTVAVDALFRFVGGTDMLASRKGDQGKNDQPHS